MSNNRLLMCMPYRQLVRKAVAAGFRVYSVWDPTLESGAYLDEVAALSEEMVLTGFDDEAKLRRVIATMAVRHDVARVLHLGREATQLAVCEEAEALGLAVNSSRALAAINDKAAMRALLDAHGISPVRSIEVPCPQEVHRARGFEFPVVVKPTRLDGSRAVRLIERAHDLAAWRDEVDRLNYHGPVLIEEYLRGPEFSVETLTVGGCHHVVGITAKRLGPAPHFVEMGHVFPAPLDDRERGAITDVVVGYLDASGYRFGPAHTEVILTERGPRIVESQARIGGDRIPLLIEVATGFDIEAAVFQALAGEPVHPRPPRRLAGIAFFDFGTGRVQSVDGVEAVRELPFVHELKVKVADGDVLAPVISSQTRHGYVVVDGASPAQVAQRLAEARARLQISAVARGATPLPLPA